METIFNKKDIVLQILNEIAFDSTDATAFKVISDTSITGGYIYLVPDKERRLAAKEDGGFCEFATFYHAEKVTDLCRAFKMRSWISAKLDENEGLTFRCTISI